MKIIWISILALITGVLGFQAYKLYNQGQKYTEELVKNEADYQDLSAEEARISQDVEYYQTDENLSKELRSRFNYRDYGEELIILVPEE